MENGAPGRGRPVDEAGKRTLGFRLAAGLVLGLAGASCRAPDLYEWGEYDAAVQAFVDPSEGVDLPSEIDRLSHQIARTHDRGRRVPPGLHAHLGYLYFLAGDLEACERHLREEERLFPESHVFIEGMLGRMPGGE